MDTATLVSFDIDNGRAAIDALDQAGCAPDVALWAKLPDYEDWRLVIASSKLDQPSQFTGYWQINEALQKAGIPIHRQPTILLRSMNHPMIRALREAFANTRDTYGMRVGGQTFGDKYLEDAFVYRIR